MAKKAKPIISIRVTEEEKESIQNLAVSNGMTVTDYLKQKALYDVKDGTILDTDSFNREVDSLSREIDRLTYEVEALRGVEKAKDITVTTLQEQLEQANKRIDDYSRQLEQQQSLQLGTVQTNRELQLKIDTLEEDQKEVKDDSERKGFFSRLFSGN